MNERLMINSFPVEQLHEEFKDLNDDLNKGLKSFSACIESMLAQFKTNPDQLENNKGLSFLSLKNMLMIEYLLNLLHVIQLKESGKAIKDHKSIVRLAELRCVIEKSKSIDVKLKYQIDKLLKLAVSSDTNEQDPLSFKANLDNFEANDEEEEEDDDDVIKMGGDEDENEGDKKRDNVYRPPKLVPTYNDIDQTPQDKLNKELERRKRRALHSSIMKELEAEYSGAPEEIKDGYANTLETETQEERHRINYEEDNFTRKPLTKKEMMRAKRLRSGANLNSLSSFEDARLLLDENINMEEYLSAEKSKKKSSKAKKGKKGKKGQKKKKIRYT